MDLSKHAFFEGKIVLLADAKVNIATHGFLYGTAVFSGMRAYWNEEQQSLFVFRPYDHFRRLLHSAKIMSMQSLYDEEGLIQLTLDLLKTDNWQRDIYLRPTFYKADMGIGVRLHDLAKLRQETLHAHAKALGQPLLGDHAGGDAHGGLTGG